MGPLQLIANNPAVLGDGEVARRVRASGKLPTDKNCNKLKELKDLLLSLEGKTVLFSSFSEYGAQWLYPTVQSWGIEAVLYDGSSLQMERAKRRFREDPACRVFVSSDKGSDSINLEAAVNVVNYDLPWKYSTLLQRVNRISRITSKALGHDHVFYYNLVNSGTIEDRKQVILERKKGYAEAVFGGPPPDDQMEEFSKLTRGDVLFMLTGDEEETEADAA
jgi:SNF2 family DNA or RNA helicase